MSRLERIVIRGDEAPSLRERAADLWGAVKRSIWLGPYNSKDPVLARMFGGSPSSTGINVNETNAFTVAAFFSAVTLIAGDAASLPLMLLKRLPGGGKERFISHPLFRLLHDQPNSEMGSMQFRETLLLHALATGNAYAEIERDVSGRPYALWPLLPHNVTPFRTEAGRLQYRIRGGTGAEIILEAADVVHLRGPGPDGIHGYSTAALAREALGLSLAAERFGGKYFSNGAHLGGALSTPLVGKAIEHLRESIDSLHGGIDKAHKFLLLEGNTSYTPFGTSPRDSQFVELRTHQIREVARFFKIPPSKLGDLSDSNYSTVEQQNLDYFTSCLRPWLTRVEEEFTSKLINPVERQQQVIEHVTEGFLVGDHAARSEFYASGLAHGWLTPNEVRARENLPPIEGGDVARAPMNTAPLKEIA